MAGNQLRRKKNGGQKQQLCHGIKTKNKQKT